MHRVLVLATEYRPRTIASAEGRIMAQMLTARRKAGSTDILQIPFGEKRTARLKIVE